MRETVTKTKLENNQKGITLIALVITIIVLLILAGVAISMLSGENGILKQAASAKVETETAQAVEEVELMKAEAIIYDKTANKNDEAETTITNDEGVEETKTASLQELIQENVTEVKLNKKIYNMGILQTPFSNFSMDLNGNELIFSDKDEEQAALYNWMNLNIIDTSEGNTGKIIYNQKARCEYNEKYDVNKDGVVCWADAVAVSYAYSKSYTDPVLDVTGDGYVLMNDAGLIASNIQYAHIIQYEEQVVVGTDANAPQENYIEQGCTHHKCYTQEEYYNMAVSGN